jgi:hypothetical protein
MTDLRHRNLVALRPVLADTGGPYCMDATPRRAGRLNVDEHHGSLFRRVRRSHTLLILQVFRTAVLVQSNCFNFILQNSYGLCRSTQTVEDPEGFCLRCHVSQTADASGLGITVQTLTILWRLTDYWQRAQRVNAACARSLAARV